MHIDFCDGREEGVMPSLLLGRDVMGICRKKHDNIALILFCFPFLVIFTLFFLFPLAYGFIMSFTNMKGFMFDCDFVFFDNYKELLSDKRFLVSTGNTLTFTFFNVLFSNFLAIVIAFSLENKKIIHKNFFRTFFFVPYIFALVIIGFIWKFIYAQTLPQIAELYNIRFLDKDYLGDPHNALKSVIIMQIWYQIGYFLVIYIAGLQSIDKSLLEVAQIDGASNMKINMKIELPLLMPTVSVCLFTGLAFSLKAFDSILALTGGGPGYSTEVLSLNIYYEAMGEAQRFGYGMAKSVVLAFFVCLITVVQRKLCSKEIDV